MGIFDRFKRTASIPAASSPSDVWDFAAAKKTTEAASFGIYENTSVTVRGEPTGYDFDTLMRNPQDFNNLVSLYQLSLYYKETDPMYGGAIKNVYVPFSIARSYRLIGASEDTKEKYQAHMDRIGFRDKLVSIFDQLYTFSNVYIYLMPDGNIITLQPNRCTISDVLVDGEPLILYNTKDLMKKLITAGSVTEGFVKSFEARLKGLPPEVAAEMKKKVPAQYVQLDPENTFVLQAPKPDWMRYSPPSILPCLNALSRKALIGEYEKAQLQFGIKGFLHVKVGDKDSDTGINAPTGEHITQMYTTFEKALQGGKQAVTPWYVNAEFVTVDTKTLFDKDKYQSVNNEILSACGIAGVVVNGQQESGSYGSAKLSLETAALRIRQNQANVEEMMNKILLRLADRIPRISTKNIPKFEFPDVDLTNDGKFAESAFKLWQQGVVSNQTLLDTFGFDIVQEFERKKAEQDEDQISVFVPPQNAFTSNTGDKGKATPEEKPTKEKQTTEKQDGGRPKKKEGDRISDPEKSETGAQPKPSNPDGS